MHYRLINNNKNSSQWPQNSYVSSESGRLTTTYLYLYGYMHHDIFQTELASPKSPQMPGLLHSLTVHLKFYLQLTKKHLPLFSRPAQDEGQKKRSTWEQPLRWTRNKFNVGYIYLSCIDLRFHRMFNWCFPKCKKIINSHQDHQCLIANTVSSIKK